MVPQTGNAAQLEYAEIQASGALLWRQSPEGNQVAVIFRNRYQDWTLPKGKLQEGENWEQTALREVVEETGYEAERVEFLGAVHPNPAIQNNLCHTFLACDARPRQAQKLDGSEDIEVQEVSWAEIPKMIDQGEITHSLVITAFFWYKRFLSRQPPPPVLSQKT